MKKRVGQVVGFTLALLTVLGAAALAADAGTQQDPLVTLSYLNDTYLPSLLSQVDTRIAQRDTQVAKDLEDRIDDLEEELAKKYGTGSSGGNAASVFAVVTLSRDQVLTGGIGCEVMLRVGTASCVADGTPGLVDTTSGSTLSGGKSLETNHLYMMTVEGRGVKATADTVKLLVRGSYTVA